MPVPTTVARLEAVLAERAEELGVEIRRGLSIVSFEDNGSKVHIKTQDHDFAAEYLVVCDGGRSTVRKLGDFDFDFAGTGDEFIGYIATCELDKPELLKPGFIRTKAGMYINAPSPDTSKKNVYAIDFDLSWDRSQPLTPDHFQTVLRRVSGLDITVEAIHLSTTFTARSMQVTEYRRGRVFLAGDSAHIHSPLGAQGVNAGIGDTMNLGWKLAAAVKGHAAPGLLETYHTERHPVGAAVLEWTRAQLASLRPNPFDQVMAKIIEDFMGTKEGATYMVDKVWCVSQKYDCDGGHDIIGRSVPDLAFVDESQIGTKLADGCFLLVDFEDDQSVAGLAKSLPSSTCVVAYHGCAAKEAFSLKTILIRPDGVIAWASTAEDFDLSALNAAMEKWVKVGAS